MIDELSNRISGYIVSEGISPDADRDKLAYGFRKIFNYIIQVIILAVIALLSGRWLNFLAFTLFYCPLRTRVGGAHSNSRFGCMAVFTLIAIIVVGISVHIPAALLRPVSAVIAVLSVAIVFAFAPITHPNAPKREKTLAKCKRQGRIIVLIESAAVLLSCLTAPVWTLRYIFCAALGTGTVSLFLLIPVLKERGGET